MRHALTPTRCVFGLGVRIAVGIITMSGPASAGGAAVGAAAGAAAGAAVGAAAAEVADAPGARPDYVLEPVLGGLLDDAIFRVDDVGVQVVDLSTGDEVWAWQPDLPLIPASVTKLLTTAVALRTLGPGWTFDTDMLASGDVDADGVLHGDLYVRGGGDPTLVVEQLWKMVVDLQSAGVLEIDGDVIFDDSFFSDPGFVPGWNKAVDEANGPAYFAPLGALSLNYNAACVLVAAGGARGESARVDIETPADVITVDNQVITGSTRARRWLKVQRDVAEDGAHLSLVVSGVVPLESDTVRIYRAVADPTAHFMAVFRSLLAGRGLTWTGDFVEGTTPGDAQLLTRHSSESLGIVLARMNKRSSNIMAEQVLKSVAAVAAAGPGSTADGVEIVRTYLDELGISRDDYILVNGSGLSRDARLRPSTVTAVLADLYQDRRVGPEFQASLSLAGVDGTLRRRLGGEDAGLVRGKTGSINGVYCLAGYVTAADGHVYAFAFFVNGIHGSTRPTRALQDRFAKALLAVDGRLVHGDD